MRFETSVLLAALVAIGSAPGAAGAVEPAADRDEPEAAAEQQDVEPATVFDSLTVTGGPELVELIPGSATFIVSFVAPNDPLKGRW